MSLFNRSRWTGNDQEPGTEKSELRKALNACRSSFLFAGFFSLFVNLLLLTPSFYMLAVYDRVVPSNSESTLAMLTLITVFLFLVMGVLDWIRSRILISISVRLDRILRGRLFDAIFLQSLSTSGKLATTQPMGDLLQLRQFLTGQGMFAFFDAPWMPIYLALMFMFHPVFGWVALGSALILLGLAIWNEVSTRSDLEQANREANETTLATQRNLRNAEVVEAMGMRTALRKRWEEKQASTLELQTRASIRAGFINMLVKTYRLTIQSLVLGLGAYLSLRHEITPGLMIAGSILLGRALAPLDTMVSQWRGFLGARESYHKLNRLLASVPRGEPPMTLPAPDGRLVLEDLVVTPPGAAGPVLKGLSLVIEPGTLVAVVGPSASGKSTLIRALLGLYPLTRGKVRLDGADIAQWDRDILGGYLGYLPQDVEILDGTISENIARFGEVNPTHVVEAARLAGIHEMILAMPSGYDTRLVGGGGTLSAGQQQRLGIARALYNDPRVILLDEPNSNLDHAGDAALLATLSELRRRGKTVVVVTHRTNVLDHVDRILVLVGGQVSLYGPREQVIPALMPQSSLAKA